MNDFAQQSNQMRQPFAMEQLLKDLPANAITRRSPSPGWAAEFDAGDHARMAAAFPNTQMGAQRPNGFSPQEFAHFQQSGAHRTASPITQAPSMLNSYQRPMGMGYMGGMNMGMNLGSFHTQHHQPDQTTDKGKGRMVELDDANWEAQFKELETHQDNISEQANQAMEKELEDLDR